MIKLLGQILAVVKHPVAQVCFRLDTGAEEAHTPQEAAKDDQQDNAHHRHTDLVYQEVQVKGNPIHKTGVDAIDDHLIQIGDQQLQVVYHDQRHKTQDNQRAKTQIIPVDMLTENHSLSSSLLSQGMFSFFLG